MVVVAAVATSFPVDAAPSGLDGRIVVARWRSLAPGPDAIITMLPDGTGLTRLAEGDVTPPVWSPDGSRLAFVDRSQRNAKLQIVNADWTDPVTVLAEGDLPQELWPSGQIAWMPDGQHLVVGMNRGDTDAGDLFAIGTDGSGLVRLTPRARYATDPAVSNDGSTIAVAMLNTHARFRVVLMDPDGSDRRTVPTGPGEALAPDWSPDGGTIVFTRWDEAQLDLVTVSPDGSNLSQITDTPTRWEQDPVFAPSGTRIAYARGGLRWRPTDLFTIAPDGTDRMRLTDTSDRWEVHPSWQPLPA
jgi:Tol biopolymer transport system component